MARFPDLARRRLTPELMDQPGLDAREHRRALAALGRVNRISGVAGGLWRRIAPLAREAERPLRVLDLACGGGDVAIGLRRRAERAGLEVDVAGCDLSPTAVEYATARARASGFEVPFFRRDLLAEPLPEGYDVFCSSLFLHHLGADDARHLLSRLAASGARAVLLSDLVRSRLGYVMATIGPRLVSRSHVAHHDGPPSVCAAFTVDEIRELAQAAGLDGVTVERAWPQRFLLRWLRVPSGTGAAIQ